MDIIQRLCKLRPNSWKSDSHLNQKDRNRYDVSAANPQEKSSNNIARSQPLSKSSDWTEVDLEVPDKEDHIHLRNPKLSLIFSNESTTPTPPPRKHKKNFREKFESVAKTGLQAFQHKKPVEEPVCVKKNIIYRCPLCDQDESSHNRDHHHHEQTDSNKNEKRKLENENISKASDKKTNKDIKRRKNLSVVSLPNYDELKLTVANFDDIDKPNAVEKGSESVASLPGDTKNITTTTGSTGRLDNYITRCRSFGSLLPQQLLKFRTRKVPADIESDDSFGGLEDWDLGLLEHYNPKDASLPRPRKVQRSGKEIMSEIESLVVKEEDIENPKPPVRRSESLIKKINREAIQVAHKTTTDGSRPNKIDTSKSVTPPPSPIPIPQGNIFLSNLPTTEDGKVEHSSLMKILEEFSIKDKQMLLDEERLSDINDNVSKTENSRDSSNHSSFSPSLLEFEKNIAVNSIENFITAEKRNTDINLNFIKYNPTIIN